MLEGDTQAARRAEAEAAAAGLVASGALVPSLAILIDLGPDYVDVLAVVQQPPMPAPLRENLRSFLSWGHLDSCADSDPAWSLVVDALVLMVASAEPSPAVIHKLQAKLRTAPYWTLDAWRDRCAERIRSMEPGKRSAWIVALGLEPTFEPADARAKAPVTVRRAAAAWTVESPFELWDQSPSALDGGWYAPLQILARLDPNAWFLALDSWRDARLVDTAFFFGGLRKSADRILVGLQAARLRPAGDLSVSAVLLCEEAVDATEELIKVGEGSNVDSARGFLDKFSYALLSRSDGPRVGAAHAARLLGFQLLNRKQEGASKHATALALDEVLRHLRLAEVRTGAQKKYWAERKRLTSRVFVRHELLALFVARRSLDESNSTDDLKDLMEWLRHALRLSDEWENREALDDYREELVAFLRMSSDPLQTCKALFEELETDRRRLERARGQGGGPSPVPGFLLLIAFVELLHAHEGPDWLDQIAYVRDRAIRAALVFAEEGQPVLRSREVIAMTLYLVCERFGCTDPRTLKFVAPVVDDVEVLAHLFARFRKKGIDIQMFLRGMGLDAATLVATAQQRGESLGGPFAELAAETIARALAGPE